jgi:hypothetical protein
MEAVLGAAFDRDTSFGHKTSVDLVKAGLNDRALHVSRYRALYVQRYRDRSVVALGCVGTAAATAEVATVGTAAGPPVTPEIVSLAKDSLGSQGERDRRCRTP